tara:strand:- start:384 stop:1031 length:648 start_codon:yes stop_codon:yes gene_type:complete
MEQANIVMIAVKLAAHYNQHILKMQKVSKTKNPGGRLRKLSGDLGESLSKLAWTEVGKHYVKTHSISFESVKGDMRKIIAKNHSGHTMDLQVDRHQFIDGQLVHVEECKSYLDRCYMIRASDDFRSIKKYCGCPISSSILAIENCVKKESYDFIMDEGYVETVSFLADGLRSSQKPIWKTQHYKSLNIQKVTSYVRRIAEVFEREIQKRTNNVLD